VKIDARFFVVGDSAGLAVFVEMEIIVATGGASRRPYKKSRYGT